MSRSYMCLLVLLLSACASQPPAPIVDRPAGQSSSNTATGTPPVNSAKPAPVIDGRNATYVVKKGDTLYHIALENGLAYRDLANWNNLNDVNDIRVDQVLRLTPPDGGSTVEVRPLQDSNQSGNVQVITKSYPKALKQPYASQSAETIASQADGPIKTTPLAASSKPATNGNNNPTNGATNPQDAKKPEKSDPKDHPSGKTDEESNLTWLPPTTGKLLKPYSEDAKGVDIAGKIGQPIISSESGKVVYAGSGLRGYGKMVIIKHNNAFLTAYAHNSKLLVKEGDTVKRGEKIAEMGNSDADQVKLHFEMRKFGKPVDPTKFITADRP